jgi:1-acyl-sn-glycerol-3-phosphate acyltransferase
LPRTVFGWTCIVIITVILGTMAFMTFPFDRRGYVIHRYARWWGWLILKANRVRVEVLGREHLDARRPCIYMCNHQGSFDIFSLLAYLRVPFRWLAKAELFKIPILGWAMRTAGYISLDRSAKRKAYQSMEIAAGTIKKGTSVVIFPEGSRSLDGALQPFMNGGFTLAIKAGVPICPVAIAGSWQIMPRTTLRIKKGNIHIIISEPIETKGLMMQDRRRLIQTVEGRIREPLIHAA